jgi:anaphase-promoting complex subunit 6
MFRSALAIAQVTQTSQDSWAITWLNLGTSLRKLGQLNEAQEAYVKVLEIDSRSAPALGFLGLVYHLMDRLEDAIVKYHEVCIFPPLLRDFSSSITVYLLLAMTHFEVGHTNSPPPLGFDLQALSINPINAHVVELLNLALEASADAGPFARLGAACRSEEWVRQLTAHATRQAQIRAAARDKEKEKGAESSLRAVFGDAQEGEAGMVLG